VWGVPVVLGGFWAQPLRRDILHQGSPSPVDQQQGMEHSTVCNHFLTEWEKKQRWKIP